MSLNAVLSKHTYTSDNDLDMRHIVIQGFRCRPSLGLGGVGHVTVIHSILVSLKTRCPHYSKAKATLGNTSGLTAELEAWMRAC